MNRGTRRLAIGTAGAVLLGTLMGTTCALDDPVITLESLDVQLEAQRTLLCERYADRGEVPDLTTYDPDCP